MNKIKHERMRAIIDFNSPHYEEMIMYIEQQEKQEQLLALYKKLNELWKELNKYPTIQKQVEIQSRIIEVSIQIKELEDE